MQKNAQQLLSRVVGFIVATLVTLPAHLIGSPAAAATGAPGPIPSVRFDGNGAKSVSISWDAPFAEGSFPVTDYRIEYRGAGGSWTVFDDGVSAERSATVSGLEAGREYEFRVAAVNLAGIGPASALGIGENFLSSGIGTCALNPVGDYVCVEGRAPYVTGTWIEDPAGILAAERVADLTMKAGFSQNYTKDLQCVLSKSKGAICVSRFNQQGQLGQGNVGAPIGNFVIPGLPENLVDISVVDNTACVLSASGELWCWGRWSSKADGRQMLTPTLQFRGVKDLAGNCAIQWDDTITCYTTNTLEFRWATNAAAPTARALSANGTSVCAITTARGVICFSNLPVAYSTIAYLHDVVEFDKRNDHWCALIADGSVTCNGNNDVGQLGDGSYAAGPTSPRLPEPIVRLAESDEASGTTQRSCAIGVSATVYCWGNLIQLLGISTVPKVIGGLGPWTAHSAVAPSQVTGLTQSGRTATTVSATWSVPERGDMAIDKFVVEWRIGTGSWTSDDVPAHRTTWTSPTVPASSTVDVRVSAVSAAGQGAASETLSATTAAPPLRPLKPTVSLTTSTSVAINWRPASSAEEPVTSYAIEWTTDRTHWNVRTVSAGETSTVFTNLVPGSAIDIRVRATNAAGTSAPSETVSVFTTGLSSHSIAVVDSTGQAVFGGQVTWQTRDGRYESALDYGLTSDGRVTFPYIPAGEVDVALNDVQLLSGSVVSFDKTVTIGYSGGTTITLPAEPSNPFHTVRVTLPNGLPVVGATVVANGLFEFANVGAAYFFSPEIVETGVTNEFGEVYLSGYSDRNTTVFVEYNDGVLIQRFDGPLGLTDKDVDFDDMPWIEVPDIPSETVAGAVVPVTVTVHGVASNSSNVQRIAQSASVSIVAPSGAPQKCAGRKLTSTVDISGRATLKLCATKSGRYVVAGKGVVSTGAVALKVKGAAPQPVVGARAISPSHKNVRVMWSAPTYAGGNPITKYTVKLSRGKKTMTKVVTGTSAEFSGLPGASKWTVTVTATSKFGTSEPVRLLVPVS